MKPWKFAEGIEFEYVHTRALSAGINNWDALIAQAWAHLKPGGWIELQEGTLPTTPESTIFRDGVFFKYVQGFRDGLLKVGMDSDAALLYTARLKKQGFVDAKEVKLRWPLGPWAKGEKRNR